MRALSSLALLALLLPVDALACGGFFCDRDFPIDQSAEQIVFGVDLTTGLTTVHIGITYQGASEDFAWVVPVPSVPELELSSDALFTAISAATEPRFWLHYDASDTCGWWGEADDSVADFDGEPAPESGGVTVIAEERVGPYETVTLQAESSGELLTWLNGNGYDLPATLDPVLAPYVAGGQYFVALKLSAGQDTGDLAPLAMTYPSTSASIPIQLTSIAATPDMRLEAYVLGDARAVPDNYLHVTINEAAIDWFNGGTNYDDVVTLAADEAGGQAFATDFSGSTTALRGTLWQEGRYDLDSLRSLDTPVDWVQGLMNMGFPPSAALLELFMDLIPFPAELEAQGVSAQNFYDCLGCYAEHIDGDGFSGEAATDALEAQVIEGLRTAERLFAAHGHVTRMTSSMDAVEMTVDPVFTFNRDLPQEVSNLYEATVELSCETDQSWYEADRVLVLSDGRRVALPSQSWMDANGTTELEYMGDLTSPAAILIEDLGSAGQGEIVFDFRPDAADRARDFNGSGSASGSGCACDASGGTASLWGVALIGLAVGRRRRA